MRLMFPAAAVTLIVVWSGPAAAGIVDRAEKTDLRDSDGKPVARVKKDADGNVTELVLTNMELKAEELAELEGLPKLRCVVLYRTNVGDNALKHLAKCPLIESLNLTSTNVTDEALDALAEFKSLKYLCLGDVRITPEAVKKLKDKFRARKQDVQLGYSQRRP
jgi:hypothetical protein